MAARLDQGSRPYGGAYAPSPVRASGGSGETIIEQVRQRPLLALGLGLIAGSLLQDYLADSSANVTRPLPQSRPTYPQYGSPSGASATGVVREGLSDAADTVGDVAHHVGRTVSDAAEGAVGTVIHAASTVADTTATVASGALETAGDVAEEVTERAGDLASTVSDFVTEQPLMALGLSLAAGSLLQRYLKGGQTSVRPSYDRYGTGYASYPPYDAYADRGLYTPYERTPGEATRDAVGRVGNAAHRAVDTTLGTASSAVDTAVDAADRAVDTVADVASSAADTAVDAAQRAGGAVVNVAEQVVDTTGDAVGYVADTVSDLWPTLTRQVQQRPLTTFAVSLAAGMLLQPVLAPHVKAVSSDVGDVWNAATGSVGDIANLPEPPEVQRIKAAIVPATVERSRQLLNHEVRDYLESSLEGMIGQASLRAGVVAAITDKAEEFADQKLPTFLNGLSGTPALLLLGLTGAALEAYNQAQQGQGQTIANVRTNVSQAIITNAQEQLSRYFPEFRQRMESQGAQAGQQDGSEQCPNCGSQVAPQSRFCPNCGKEMTGGTSV
jgi:ElaB/YqjD/DUF883 family membrane-anchored ribosome-binding protein